MQSALPCDEQGNFLPKDAPPPPPPVRLPTDWSPFENRPAFEFAEFTFEKSHASTADVNAQLRMWQAYNLLKGHDTTMYDSMQDVLNTIDDIAVGDLPWSSFDVRYTGAVDHHSPSWMRQTYTVYTRDTLAVQQSILENQDFAGGIDYIPYQAFTEGGARQWCNLMSANWAWKQAVSDSVFSSGRLLTRFLRI